MTYQQKIAIYESYKRDLSVQGLSHKEYEKRLMQKAKQLKL